MAKKACPTPRKHKFRDRIAAALFASRDGGYRINGSNDSPGRDTQEPYPCPCGKWHVRTAGKHGGSPK